jgi:hypothetical protein
LNTGTINNSSTFPPASYPDWIAKWWRWINIIPKIENPANDDTGENCTQKQSGPVWFLAGTLSKKAERKCEIPGGKALLFPIITTEMPRELYKDTNDMTSAAISEMDGVTDLEFHITVGRLRDWKIARVLTPPYEVTYIPDGIYEVTGLKVETTTQTEAVSDGYWVFSESLNAGDYGFTFRGKSPTFENAVTYRLHVS